MPKKSGGLGVLFAGLTRQLVRPDLTGANLIVLCKDGFIRKSFAGFSVNGVKYIAYLTFCLKGSNRYCNEAMLSRGEIGTPAKYIITYENWCKLTYNGKLLNKDDWRVKIYEIVLCAHKS